MNPRLHSMDEKYVGICPRIRGRSNPRLSSLGVARWPFWLGLKSVCIRMRSYSREKEETRFGLANCPDFLFVADIKIIETSGLGNQRMEHMLSALIF